MADAVLIGGGGHAGVVLQASCRNGLRVLGYTAPTDDSRTGLPYLGTDEQLAVRVDPQTTVAIFGIGKTDVSASRLSVFDRLVDAGFRFPPLVAAGAIVHDDVTLGDGTVVMDGAVIVTGTKLGRACIVNTNATIDHDCMLGEDVHVAPGATISGGVVVGSRCMIGTGAALIHGIRICDDCLIGAGATVVSDITAPGVWVGTPARKIR